jgi:hypothetical protein
LPDEPITRCRFRDCYRKQKLKGDSFGVTLSNGLPACDSLGNTYQRGCRRHHLRRPLAPVLFSRAKAPANTHTRAIRPSISTRSIPGYDRRFAVKAAGRWRSSAACSYRVRRSFTRKRKSCAVSASRARLQREQLELISARFAGRRGVRSLFNRPPPTALRRQLAEARMGTSGGVCGKASNELGHRAHRLASRPEADRRGATSGHL